MNPEGSRQERQGRQARRDFAARLGALGVLGGQTIDASHLVGHVLSGRGRNTYESCVLREPDPETDQLAFAVIGAALEVHRLLGPGFLESVYEAALAAELATRRIRFEQQKIIPVLYKGRVIATHRLDLLVGERLVVELKAVETIAPIHVAQMISYLTATEVSLGLLINFQVPLLKQGIHRVVRTDASPRVHD